MAKDAVQLIYRFSDPDALAQALANRIAELIGSCQAPFRIALAGGSTPKLLYQHLSRRKDIDWLSVELYLGDERMIPASDPRSNENMIREMLGAVLDSAKFFPIYTGADQAETARQYASLLPSRLDLAILGVGDDGHTASVFPDTEEQDRNVYGTRWPEAAREEDTVMERVTLSLSYLANSAAVYFLVAGEKKAQRVADATHGRGDSPSARLARTANHVEWWLDEAAAARI
jgi:6-phosphogluconolactonase